MNKMARILRQAKEQNKIDNPKFSEIDLGFVKNYLYVDYEDDDKLITLLVESTKKSIMFEAGLTEATELDECELANTLLLMIVSDLYNSRSAQSTDTKIQFSPLYEQMMKSIRGQFYGYKF